jgi:hypothetical protein
LDCEYFGQFGIPLATTDDRQFVAPILQTNQITIRARLASTICVMYLIRDSIDDQCGRRADFSEVGESDQGRQIVSFFFRVKLNWLTGGGTR